MVQPVFFTGWANTFAGNAPDCAMTLTRVRLAEARAEIRSSSRTYHAAATVPSVSCSTCSLRSRPVSVMVGRS